MISDIPSLKFLHVFFFFREASSGCARPWFLSVSAPVIFGWARGSQGVLEVEVFEWPKFDTASRAVFEEFAQQLNNAVGYRFGEVTLRGLADTDVGL